ncbi:MAG: hypothetical protein IPK85_04080 [Gemmatimonadetes bacterium]|nr:hypothetical protein [Gemmatimonadota bacterium]
MGVIKVRAANKTYSYRSGGAVDGATGFTGSVIPFTSLVQSATREYTYKTVSQAAITDTDDQLVPTRVNGSHRFTCFVPAAGYTFKSLNGTYIEITEQVLALTAEVLVGMVGNWSESESDDGNLMESFTVTYGVVGV